MERSEELRLQFELARVVERKDKPPALQRSTWRADAEHFCPTSAIKLCAAVGVLGAVGRRIGEPAPHPSAFPKPIEEIDHTATERSFFLAGTLSTNADGVLDDGVYGYDTLALPFWADLGEVLARELLLGPAGR